MFAETCLTELTSLMHFEREQTTGGRSRRGLEPVISDDQILENVPSGVLLDSPLDNYLSTSFERSVDL